MNPLKKLAGQTAIYGVSSIVGRLLNYFLVPLFTYKFENADFGVFTEMYAYVAFLIVILIHGMETAFFRYSEREDNKAAVYSTSFISVFAISLIFVSLALGFSGNLAELLGKNPASVEEYSQYVKWMAMIIAMDAITAIPFAKLRAEQKATRFAVIKLINIGVNIGLNLTLILLVPWMVKTNMISFMDPEPKISYIFIANLVASSVTVVLLLPDLFKMHFQFDVSLWKKMLPYALPLLVLGLSYNINELADRVLLKYLLPGTFDENMAQLGIYGACYKLSILMTIFIQAFRYAAEPFFFEKEKEKDAREVYADVLKYFVIVCSVIFLGVTLYIDIFQYFIGPEYRSGLHVVPILLLANLFMGIFYNLSVWYKLTGKTHFGMYISIIGAIITIAGNILVIPIYGYTGSAWITLICYGTMMVISYFMGQRHYRIEYGLRRVFTYLATAIVFYLISDFLELTGVLMYSIHTLLILGFAGLIYILERPQKIVI